jgi:hypothetical protein
MLTFVTLFQEGGPVTPEKFYFNLFDWRQRHIPKAGDEQDNVLPSNFAGSALTLASKTRLQRGPFVFRELIVVFILPIHRKKN